MPARLFSLAQWLASAKVSSVSSAAAQLSMFPELLKEELNRHERTRWNELTDMAALSEDVGELVPIAVAGMVLDVSSTRVSQLIGDGRFRSWEFFGRPWVCQQDLAAYVKSERKEGRPLRERSAKDMFRQSLKAVKEMQSSKRR